MSSIFSSSWTVIVLVALNLGVNWYLNNLSEEEKNSAKGKALKGILVVIVGLLVVSIVYTIISII